MDQRSAARRYGWFLGALAGVFAALQVLISTSAALADAGNLLGAQHGLSDGTADPQFLFGPLMPPVVATYLAMLLAGAIMLYLARQAGWLAAYVSGRREAGMSAGGLVALISGGIWVALSILVVFRVHADGTITGLFTSNPTGPLQPLELPGLLVQELAAVLIGWGLGSMMGQSGAANAPLSPASPGRRPGTDWLPQGGAVSSAWHMPPQNPEPPTGTVPYALWPPEVAAPTGPRQTRLEDGDLPSPN
jgi:hypothetical protein